MVRKGTRIYFDCELRLLSSATKRPIFLTGGCYACTTRLSLAVALARHGSFEYQMALFSLDKNTSGQRRQAFLSTYTRAALVDRYKTLLGAATAHFRKKGH